MTATIDTPHKPSSEPASSLKLLRTSISHLREEYEAWRSLLDEQPATILHSIQSQAATLADAIVRQQTSVQFQLPAELVIDIGADGSGKIGYVPTQSREQQIGGVIDRLTNGDIGAAIRQRLNELDQSSDHATAMAAGLLRHATAIHMVYNMLPAGHSVTYLAEDDDEIASIPQYSGGWMASALTARTDVIAEENAQGDRRESGRGELIVPYTPYARCFFLPQWVVFDGQGQLLASSMAEAQAAIGSMLSYMRILHTSVALAPYMMADHTYQAKRYGTLGELVNQGRAFANYETRTDIVLIRQRAGANDLNRGLALSLPYFDDQALELRLREFEIIPAGRIRFIPALVVRAALEEQAKVAQDTRLSPSTRRHLLAELRELESTFRAGESHE